MENNLSKSKPVFKIRCKIREDLQEMDLIMPVGTEYVSGNGTFFYKWVKENFFIYHKNKWLEANSIDFDFSV